MAGLSDWHRKQKKKETAKNKEARKAARDAKALEKTVPQIKEEIRQIEREDSQSQQPGPDGQLQEHEDFLQETDLKEDEGPQ